MIKKFIGLAVFSIVIVLCTGCSTNKKGFKPHNKHKKDCGCSHWSNNITVPVQTHSPDTRILQQMLFG